MNLYKEFLSLIINDTVITAILDKGKYKYPKEFYFCIYPKALLQWDRCLHSLMDLKSFSSYITSLLHHNCRW
jgi:hypothetical protein